MDINDIRNRLKRILHALDATVDDDYQKHFKIERNGESVTTTFPANGDKLALENQTWEIIHLLGTVKDNLKKAIVREGGDGEFVERCINESPYLQILMDLWNADKHGYPVRRSRSGKNPKIQNIHQGAINNNNGQPIIALVHPDGGFTIPPEYPAPSVVLVADIVDEHNTFIIDYEILVEACYNIWNGIASHYNLFV